MCLPPAIKNDMMEQLATATALLLYSHLRSQTGKFRCEHFHRYSKRFIDGYDEDFPLDLLYIIQQFGISQQVEWYKNNSYFHIWDMENADTYGLSEDHYNSFQ